MMLGSCLPFDRLLSMFDFFFKRARSRAAATTTSVPGISAPAAPATPTVPDRRQQALDQAAALAPDEAAALAFMLGCAVPEARLQAARHLHTRPMMEQARKAMRETDRRVVKLMQQRLADLAQQDRVRQRLHDAIERARALDGERILVPNQVVELDRAWAAVGSTAGLEAAEFEQLRTALGARLQAQAALQRRVMDMVSLAQATCSAENIPVEQLNAAVRAADDTLEASRHDREASSLPKQLIRQLNDVHRQLSQIQADLMAQQGAVSARLQALAAWELLSNPGADEPAAATDEDSNESGEISDTEAPSIDMPTPQGLRQQWRALPTVDDPEQDAPLQARFDALLARLGAPQSPAKKSRPVRDTVDATARIGSDSSATVTTSDNDEARAVRAAALEELRAALDEGALQRAVEQDRLLRSLDAGDAALTPQQRTTLSAARTELTRLQGWAKWGGTVSREELVMAVESLPRQQLGVIELGKKVGSMRERWRALDTTAGPAPRPLWLRFDAACGTAYAPVAAHFAALTQERDANVDKARAILAEIAAFVPSGGVDGGDRTSAGSEPDWRAVAGFCQRMEQAWQRLGPLDRKQQKQLHGAFVQALAPLRQPLALQQDREIARREQLIGEVDRLSPQGRETLEQLQALQAQWQQHAKAFPLARAHEQALWQRFRVACDTVFAQRKQAATSADAERSVNLEARIAVCVALEELASDVTATDAARATSMREQKSAWMAIGPVPRAAQSAVQTRFENALGTLQEQRDAVRRGAAKLQVLAFNTALAECLACERQLLQPLQAAPQSAPRAWEPTPNLPAPLERALQARFDAAQQAMAQADTAYAERLFQQQGARDAALLKLEVSLGIDSPPEFARERLQLQVVGLQSTFKSGIAGAAVDTPLMQLARLCALPARCDAAAEARMKAIARLVLPRD